MVGMITGALFLPALASASDSQENQPPVPVQVSKISLNNYQEYGDFYGTIEGFKEANLISHSGGEVQDILIKSGDHVKKGQNLCNIDGSIAKVRYDSAVLAQQIARKDYDRILLHKKNGNASDLQVSKIKLAWLQAKNSSLEAKKAMESSFCQSPIEGVVTGVNIKQYENLSPGSPTISIARIAQVRMLVGVPESEASVYDKGRPVKVLLNSEPQKHWNGTLDNLALKINRKDKTFTAEVWVDNPDLTLKPGLTAKARILKYDLQDKIVIPSQAILVRDQKQVVMIADENQVARSREVSIMTSYNDKAVIASGINQGEKLIVKGQNLVIDGAKIKVVP